MDNIINIWQELKQYVNAHPIGHIIERQVLKDMFKEHIPEKRPDGGYTFDKYITYLTKYEILEHVDVCRYKIKKRIPESMTSESLKKVVYRKRYNKKHGMLEV